MAIPGTGRACDSVLDMHCHLACHHALPMLLTSARVWCSPKIYGSDAVGLHRIFNDETVGAEAKNLFEDGQKMLKVCLPFAHAPRCPSQCCFILPWLQHPWPLLGRAAPPPAYSPYIL